MLKAKDKNNVLVYIDHAIIGETYYCPVCNQPMIQRRGEINIHHFAHYSPHSNNNIVPCSDHWNYCKTEWHINWQKRFPVECMERVLEKNGNKHIADVLVGNYVVEFQHSSITLEEFNERNEFYTSFGYKVIWVFDLTEEYDDGRFALNDDESEWYFKWAYPKKLFKEMDFDSVNATIFFQLSNADDDESCVLEQVTNIYHEGKNVKTKYNGALAIKEFVDMITANKKEVLAKPRESRNQVSTDDCHTIVELWKENYSSMIVKNKTNSVVIRVFGKDGRLVRNQRNDTIRCKMQYLDKYSNYYKDIGEFRDVMFEDQRVWVLVHAFLDKGYEERIAKRKKEEEKREEERQKYLKETEPYRNAEQNDCYPLNQLIHFNGYKRVMFIENVYTKKQYRLVVSTIDKYEIFEIDPKNICKTLTGNLKEELSYLVNFRIWKNYNK